LASFNDILRSESEDGDEAVTSVLSADAELVLRRFADSDFSGGKILESILRNRFGRNFRTKLNFLKFNCAFMTFCGFKIH
jgi:hypothetical protein